jgi:hypothetical protein
MACCGNSYAAAAVGSDSQNGGRQAVAEVFPQYYQRKDAA